MKKTLAIIFFLVCFVFLSYETFRMLVSWSAGWTGRESIYFKDDDAKLIFLWLVLLLAGVSYFVWPASFQAKPTFSKGQVVSIALAVSGILAFQKVVFGAGYLKAAEDFGYSNQYVVCDATRYRYFGELKMSKDWSKCQ